MSRHSKWHKVKQFKGAVDAKRSASFTKLAREIMVAVREKGPDPGMNVRLKVAIERAKKASMPKDNIERAVLRGAGNEAEGRLETLLYEAYAPGGTALIIECVTDNRNRTANDVKHLLTKHGATLAAAGAVTYLFDRKGVIIVSDNFSPDRELAFIEAGAEDIKDGKIFCSPQDLARVAEASSGLKVESADFEWIPKMTIETNEEAGTVLEELIDALEELDDVSHVYTNAA
ncbi:YebC/PmpR family DNA-binding transcriptional regulator [Patescibacteria group bacterium]|nr:YebC/PmpR family DNA-binding transcriptional regulator [Patescibacteria group bacterium]MBU1034800.1 YebC/PmpR family DNA-binding transcriptional regulator [Patescibacteria group bacterium]MBU1629936.1 YebC/PmpR family DNA-binding transcriptional regulator [Patescibacteria group bacterium]MBU1908113.1 YebC/PmpR family DNA-binding transcriptional regulator [Patescibacteria group bacterium]